MGMKQDNPSVLSLDIPGASEYHIQLLARRAADFMARECAEVRCDTGWRMVPTGKGYPFRDRRGGDRTGRVSMSVRQGEPQAVLERVQAFMAREYPGLQYSSRIGDGA